MELQNPILLIALNKLLAYLDNSEFDEFWREPDEFVGVYVRVLCPLVAEGQEGGLVHDDGCPPRPVILVGHHVVLLHLMDGLVNTNGRLILLREGEVVLEEETVQSYNLGISWYFRAYFSRNIYA